MRRSATLAVTLAATIAATTACRAGVGAIGDSPQTAKHNADELFAAFEYRFHNVERAPDFARARLQMAREALVPSRLYADTTVWPIRSDADSSRTVYLHATRVGTRYRFTATASTDAPGPTRLGDQHHVIALRARGGNDYEWTTAIDHAVGSVKPAEVGAAIVATLTAAEGRAGTAAIADAAATFPRAAAHLSQLLSLDSLRTVVLAGGATDVTLGMTVRAERLRPPSPAFAAYIGRYVTPSVYRLEVTDRRGASYFDLTGRDGRVVVKLRAHNGRLVSRDARQAPLPDALLLRTDFSAKYRMLRVGYTNLVADFTIERSERLRAWNLQFRREPAWHFPFAVDKLIRPPLRRPFQGDGIQLRLGVRTDDAGTLSFRTARLVVHESPIMRWLGRLGAGAFADFSGATEAEENRFLAELFAALRSDLASLP